MNQESKEYKIYKNYHERAVMMFIELHDEMHEKRCSSSAYLKALKSLRITLDHGIALAEACILESKSKDDNWKH